MLNYLKFIEILISLQFIFISTMVPVFFRMPFTNNINNKFEVNFETVSNRNYLKKYDIYSSLVDSHTILNSYIEFEESNENSSFRSSFEVFEDLTLSSSDSYEFVYPAFNYTSKLNANLDGNLNFDVSGYQKKYQR